MARRKRRVLGAGSILSRRTGSACLSATGSKADQQGGEMGELDATASASERHDRSDEKRRLVAADGDAEGADSVSGSDSGSSSDSADGALFCVSGERNAQATAARLGQVSLAGRSPERGVAIQPYREPRLAEVC